MSEASKHQPNNSPKLSRRFRRGMSAAVFSAGALAGASAHAVVSNANEYNKLPACEFVAEPNGLNSPSAATNKLEANGADVSGSELSIIASDGHQRRRDTDPVDRKGNIIVRAGDRLDVEHVPPVACIEAGGRVVVGSTVEVPTQTQVDQSNASGN